MDGHLWREKQESAGKLVSRSTLLARSLDVSESTEVEPTTLSGWGTTNFVKVRACLSESYSLPQNRYDWSSFSSLGGVEVYLLIS